MRRVAGRGYEHEGRWLSPEQCAEVCEFIIDQSAALRRSLDMRLLPNSFQDFLQWEESESGCHWRDLVASRLRERPTAFREQVAVGGRAARKREELKLVREITATTDDRKERLQMWVDRTNKSEAALYRRIAELNGKP
jgi:hypothetical protein